MADSAAYEIFEVGVQRDKKGKSTIRQFLDACVDFTGGVLGQYKHGHSCKRRSQIQLLC